MLTSKIFPKLFQPYKCKPIFLRKQKFSGDLWTQISLLKIRRVISQPKIHRCGFVDRANQPRPDAATSSRNQDPSSSKDTELMSVSKFNARCRGHRITWNTVPPLPIQRSFQFLVSRRVGMSRIGEMIHQDSGVARSRLNLIGSHQSGFKRCPMTRNSVA